MELQPKWELVTDGVMGGQSQGALSEELVGDRPAARLTGRVSLANDGGFLQMAFDVPDAAGLRDTPDGVFDSSAFAGISLDVRGNDETYELRLRTDQLTRPWQSFRAAFRATPEWREIRLPFKAFEANKTDQAFDPARLRRGGVLAVGRAFQADIAVSRIGFFD